MYFDVSIYRKHLIRAAFLAACLLQINQSQAKTYSFSNGIALDQRIPDSLIYGYDHLAPKAAQAVHFQDRLLAIAKDYVKLDYVPYIWGGGNIGVESTCQRCRECVVKNKVPLTYRLQRCTACQGCGLDCSHFVYKVYREAGLDYQYVSSRELARQTPKGLLKHYNVVDIGRDLSLAQPGDLLVFSKHIVLLAKVISATRADFIHVTRFRPGDRYRLGGLRWDKDKDIHRFRGRLVRILRHRRFFDHPENFSYQPQFPTVVDQLIAKLD